MVIVTAGVLIALLIDSLVEWNHYRTLVGEARATLAREIEENKKELEATLAGLPDREKHLENALRFADEMLAAGKTDIHEINLGFSLADLSAASWQSAERTGALGHMDYAEVREYSARYEFQELYADQQKRAIDRLAAAMAILAVGDPHKATPRDLEFFRQQVHMLLAEITLQSEVGKRLLQSYQEALAR